MSAEAEAILKTHALRRTPVRLGVLDVLAGNKHPLDANEIIGKLPSHIDRVTVYRTLNTFVEKKIVHRVRGEDRSWRYAAGEPTGGHGGRKGGGAGEGAGHHHAHFVCDDCGEVECLEDAEIPQNFVKSMGVERAYKVTYPEVTLHGSCPRCVEKTDE
jgi:Fur family ferric uptake transcriptional regulator